MENHGFSYVFMISQWSLGNLVWIVHGRVFAQVGVLRVRAHRLREADDAGGDVGQGQGGGTQQYEFE